MTDENFKKLNIPDKSGVYFFKKGKEILYIGKATSLKDRVKSYFGKDPEGKSTSYGASLIETRGPIIVKMVQEADRIDFQVTDSVLEAIILEANLIKKYQPKYNTKEKSDKSFNYVYITKEKLPKVVIVREKDLKNFANQKFSRVLGSPSLSPKGSTRPAREPLLGSVFGPYTSGSQLREALKIIRKIFPFLDDKSKNYLEFYKQINLVPDLNGLPAQTGRKMYLQNIKNIKLFFEGKKKKVLMNLKKEMKEYAKAREFEKAGEIKRQIFALQHINDIALIKNENGFTGNKIFDPAPFFGRIKGNKVGPSDTKISLPVLPFRIEAYDIAHMGGKNMVGVMTVVENGEVIKSEYKKFKIRTQVNADDTGALKEVLERKQVHTEWVYPNLIVVDGGIAQINITKKILTQFKLDIPIVSVLKDERHRPKNILGDSKLSRKYEAEILLANSEAHRFAIAYHKKTRNKNFLI